MKTLAVTSGKGGVGKSTLSLNIARQLTRRGKRVLLVDFDIHNKGISGLFLEKLTVASSSVNSVVNSSEEFTLERAVALSEETAPTEILPQGLLSLLPAVVPRDKFEWSSFVAPNDAIVSFFKLFFEGLAARLKLDVILLDCYGGVDSLTIAAAGIASDVILVNEPDLITFSGTLLLYDRLVKTYPKPGEIRVHFVINRITSRHSFKFLDAEYRKHLAQLTPDRSILGYFAYDKLVFEAFGEYPFFSDLMPNGMFSRKINVLIGRLWATDAEYTNFARFSAGKNKRIFRNTVALGFADPEKIIRALVSFPGWLVVPILMLIALTLGTGGTLNYGILVATLYTASSAILLLVLLIGVVEPFLMTSWLMHEAMYHRRKRNFQKMYRLPYRLSLSIIEVGTALLPSLFGLALLVGLGSLDYFAKDSLWNDSSRLIELSIWPGKVSGLKPGVDAKHLSDYSGLHLSSRASIARGRNLSNINFNEARLEGVTLEGANLSGTSWVGAHLDGATFIDCDLTTASFRGASLLHTNFRGAKLRATDKTFEGSSLLLDEESATNLNKAGAHKVTSITSIFGPQFGLSLPSEPTIETRMNTKHKAIVSSVVKAESDLADIIEIELLANQPSTWRSAKGHLTELQTMLRMQPNTVHEGQLHLLRLEYKIVTGEPESTELADWVAWLQAHNNRLMEWDWELWNSTYKEKAHSRLTNEKLRLLQRSALGQETAESFQQAYQAL